MRPLDEGHVGANFVLLAGIFFVINSLLLLSAAAAFSYIG